VKLDNVELKDNNKIELLNEDPRFVLPIGIGVIISKNKPTSEIARIYSKQYFNRHLVQYRLWENAIGHSIVNTLHPKSIIDLGCGTGSYLEGVLTAGCKDLCGIELLYDNAKDYFVKNVADIIQQNDVTTDLNLNRTFDCVMSFEVGEHIEPSGTENFINNLTTLSGQYIVLTAAPPGQRGTGHINLRPKEFWKDAIKAKGFEFQDELVDLFINEWKQINETIPEDKHPQCDYNMRGAGEPASHVPGYILRNLMVFKKGK